MESKDVPERTKRKLKKIYDSLNPAELKRAIDRKLDLLVRAYKAKNNSSKAALDKTLKPFSVRKLITEPDLVSVR